jgi:hypothetical protein
LFAGIEGAGDIPVDEAAAPSHVPESAEQEEQEPEGEEQPEEEVSRSSWALVEVEPFTRNIDVYRLRKREALREVLEDRRTRGVRLSRRILTLWYYQQNERRDLRWTG